MKRFVFSLESVLEFRRQQLEIERGKLSSLLAQMKTVRAQRAALAAQRSETHEQLGNSAVLRSEELVSLNQYEIGLRKKSERLGAQLSQLEKQFDVQRTRVMAAERNEKLLVELKKKQRANWEAESSRELESMVADFFNVKLISARRAASKTSNRTTE
jgi:flagellar export protein FliJ